MVSTASLAESPAAQDESGFDALVGPLVGPAYKLAVVLLRDPDGAQDAVQEACVKAWRNLNGLHSESAVRGWFFSIVANECRGVRRARWSSVLKAEWIERRDEPVDDTEDAHLDLARELARLPVSDRAALFLFFYLDLPLAEVGRVLKISPQAAKSRVHRAVTKLRLEMREVSA